MKMSSVYNSNKLPMFDAPTKNLKLYLKKILTNQIKIVYNISHAVVAELAYAQD